MIELRKHVGDQRFNPVSLIDACTAIEERQGMQCRPSIKEIAAFAIDAGRRQHRGVSIQLIPSQRRS
ncbi:hypothetical protein [Dactylosporangium fulvum]|uniref:Uncharacterized protein n=1 Tax=Dactylosporangium fulvum TaxID=53359 RepID=A0ABY5W8T9_9ACTN|nr:hypothetical protein [Dactylosporangium fulvum]UWP86498.1 hypothetical protein Dfulv_20545 [Dactylosporangium fulvum]